jgi:uncharacterized membrane protein
MGLLVLGLALFFTVHVLTSFRDARDTLIARYGERRYKAVYSLASGAGFVLIVLGMREANVLPVWQPPAWGYPTARWLMPLAFILLAGAYVPSNIKRFTAHPMLWGIFLWALLHLLTNGDLASLLLFGGFAVYSLYAMWSQTQRGVKPSVIAQPVSRDVLVLAIGLAAYGALFYGHRWVSGVAIV